jgi:signal transduction histidine kinase
VVERDAQGRAIRMVGSFADINERKQAEIELEEARIRAEAGSIAKSNFLANMSHEFRTPLNAIMGMTDLTLMHPTDEKQKEYLAQVKESGHELLELINNVLEFANIDLGVYKPKKEPFKLQMLFDHVEGLTRDLAERKGLCIQYHYFDQSPGTLERWVVGDADCLQKVLVKLLTNAIKFTEKGHVDLHVREVPYLDKTRLYFSVSDTGIGISEADQQKLFKLFTQVDDSSTRPFGGLGLGLVTAQKLVNLMGGEITVISDVDCGAEFSFDLNLTFIEAEEVDMYWLEQSLDKSMSLDNGVASIILPKKQGEVVEKMTALEHLNVLIDKLKSSEAESVDYWFDHQASWLTLFGQSMRNEFESLILAYEFDKVLAKIK